MMKSHSAFVYTLAFLAWLNVSSTSLPVNKFAGDPDKEVICFVYHRVGDHRYPTTNTSIKDFEAHLKYLSDNGFTMLNFSEAMHYLRSDEPVRKVAVITIDDGYTSFFKNGLPLLKKYNMPATLFINTKTVGGGDYMNWNELASAMKSGVEIGNHTHSHDFFLNLSAGVRYKVFEDEISLSQKMIEEHLGVVPEIFSYPYGEFDLHMKEIVKAAGFKAAAAQKSGVCYSDMDFFQCPRFPMSEAYSPIHKFKEKAVMRPLRLTEISPSDYIKPSSNQPILTISFDPSGLRLDQLQCFVQGGACNLKIIDRHKATVTVQANQSIAERRRTLYTITVPDGKGRWHWYSHLWINSRVRE
jgi:peptidoglycan/xylan/chitin deacetylase (PgdA/CDA1 family)